MKRSRTPKSMPGSLGESPEEIFESPDTMVAAIEALSAYLNSRYAKDQKLNEAHILGFVIESLKVEFSRSVKNIEIITHFAEGVATVLVPDLDSSTDDERDSRRVELLRFFLPALKEAQLRATVQLYRMLRPEARERLVSTYKKQSVRGPCDE